MAYLEVRNLSKTFRVGRSQNHQPLQVLDQVNFEADQNHFYCLLGPSGCGKSTLLRLMHGLIPPDEGQILINGDPVTRPSLTRGMVFQQFNLLPWRNVIGNIEYGLEVLHLPTAQRRERAMHYLTLTGLSGFESYFPAQLSGGMQQRVGLARALAIEPSMLLMDEPFGSLDALTRETMQHELLQLWSLNSFTTFFVTHDIEEAIFLADTILIMSNRPGKIAAEVPVQFARPRLESLRNTAEFAEMRGKVSTLLKETIQANTANLHDSSPF